MIYIAICDDEPIMTSKIEELLLDVSQTMGINIDISVFFDGETLEKSIEQGDEYQLIYLDIEMHKRDGIDVAKTLKESDNKALIIYVSGYENYAKDLFEVDAFRFISKPVNKEKFTDYFVQAMDKLSDRGTYYAFVYKRQKYRVLVSSILYFESCKRIISIRQTEAEHFFYGRLNDVEKYMRKEQHNFLRIHQSYLVNYNYIKVIGLDYVELVDGSCLPMSQERQKDIKKNYCRLIGKEVV